MLKKLHSLSLKCAGNLEMFLAPFLWQDHITYCVCTVNSSCKLMWSVSISCAYILLYSYIPYILPDFFHCGEFNYIGFLNLATSCSYVCSCQIVNFHLQIFCINSFFILIGSGMLFKTFGENSHEKLWGVLWKRLQWVAFQLGRCNKVCNPDGTKGTTIMHGGYLISKSYDTVGEY